MVSLDHGKEKSEELLRRSKKTPGRFGSGVVVMDGLPANAGNLFGVFDAAELLSDANT